MPEAPDTILFLGDRSPYGLSVALAILDSRLRPRCVVVPSDQAWQRVLARGAGTKRAARETTTRLIRRAVAKTRVMLEGAAPAIIDGGEPIKPIVLDPGVTAPVLEKNCAALGVAWIPVDEIRSTDFADQIRRESPGLILSAAFPLILPGSLLSIPTRGAINFHPSLLPRCRGCHPIFWTLAGGETQGGVTAHYMTADVDAGDIISQIPLPLTEEDGYESLYRRAMAASPGLAKSVERFIVEGGGHGIPQDPERATRFAEDTEEDHRIHWSGRSPAEIVALARTGEAFTTVRGGRMGVLKAAEMRPMIKEKRLSRPGRVISINEDTMVVSASGGPVVLSRVTWRGRVHQAGPLAKALGLRRAEALG